MKKEVEKAVEHLPPEERIKRLKKLEEEKKKEIKEAEELIKESEEELSQREEWKRKVPIPEIAADSTEHLSEAAQEIIAAQRGLTRRQKRKEQEKEEEETAETKTAATKEREKAASSKKSLEETLESEIPQLSQQTSFPVQYQFPAQLNRLELNTEYVVQQSQLPLNQLREEMNTIYRHIEERGYLTWQEQQRTAVIYSALDEKLRAGEVGAYSLTEEAAQQAQLTKTLSGRLLGGAYHTPQHDAQEKKYRLG